jgi:cell division protein FtsZ
VGIVTLPFLFEGKVRQEQAKIGIEKLRKQVDSLIVINKLREVYGNLGFKAGFSKADEVWQPPQEELPIASLYSKYRFKRC